MAKRQPVKPGQPITAKFLNTPQADDPAQGWGEQQASLTAQFKASEDFTTFEDLYRGNCKRYWRDRGSSAYAVNGADEYVYAWSAISSGEIFPAIYNRQSGRWEAISATAASGGASGGGGLATNNCCSTIYLAGSVDLDGLEWATDYTITLAAPIGTVTVTDQGSGTWESDVVEVTCTVDEVTVTDEYTVTMTATGNAPGEVIVTVALTLGGGYGGAAGCCETTEAGFAWKYVNCCIADPLAGWSMTRDPSGFSGKECEIGGCEICVTPVSQGCKDLAPYYQWAFNDQWGTASLQSYLFGQSYTEGSSGCRWDRAEPSEDASNHIRIDIAPVYDPETLELTHYGFTLRLTIDALDFSFRVEEGDCDLLGPDGWQKVPVPSDTPWEFTTVEEFVDFFSDGFHLRLTSNNEKEFFWIPAV